MLPLTSAWYEKRSGTALLILYNKISDPGRSQQKSHLTSSKITQSTALKSTFG